MEVSEPVPEKQIIRDLSKTIATESDVLKRRLINALKVSKFCSLCLAPENITSVETIIDIVFKQKKVRIKLLHMLEYVLQNDVQTVLASSYICKFCAEKLVQAYLFIHDTKQSSKLMNDYLNSIYNKSFHTNDLHTISGRAKPNIVIVLEDKERPPIDTNNHRYSKPVNLNVAAGNKVIESHLQVLDYCKKGKKKKQKEPRINTKRYERIRQHEIASHSRIQCKVCNKMFKKNSELIRHYKIHSKVRCKICYCMIPDAQLIEHLKESHDGMIHQCQICDLAYYSAESLCTHVKISHPEYFESYDDDPECKMCLKRMTLEELKTHKCKFSCLECAENPCLHYKYLVSCREQALNHANKMKCVDCDYVCFKKSSLLGHVNREHLDHHPFTCNDCGTQFYGKELLRKHIKIHQDANTCDYCDQNFKDKIILDAHRESCRNIIRLQRCDCCTVSFNTPEELANHKKYKHGQELIPCEICKKICLNRGMLIKHITENHKGIQTKKSRPNLQCIICENKFDTRRDYLQHMRSHSNDSKFMCRKCGMEFANLKDLEMHNRKTHCRSNKKNMESATCPICKKKLKANYVRRHMSYHNLHDGTFVRPKRKNKCDLCEYRGDKLGLETHVNRFHLKIRPYKCDVCSKDFNGSEQLRNHKYVHAVDKWIHACQICNKTFYNTTGLKRHLRRHMSDHN